MTFRRPALLIALLALIPLSVLGWGGRLHMDINRAAANGVPDDMAEWRAYARLLARNSFIPDLWKGDDPNEGPRHYIDAERYRPVAILDLPRKFSDLEGRTTRRLAPGDGIAPWVIMDLLERLTGVMAAGEWIEAAQVAAAMSHYISDLAQPLHTTEFFDGRNREETGVHGRWEEKMPGLHWRTFMLGAAKVEYLDDPWSSMLKWIDQAHSNFPAILDAEREILAAGHELDSRTFYRLFWDKTGRIFISQANDAASAVGSMWYTAWVNAGRPDISPPPEELSQENIWLKHDEDDAESSAWMFPAVFAAAAITIVGLSIRRARQQEL